jgi:predicted amidohydrolase YtcJ
MQPYHAVDDGRWAEKRIGSERIETTDGANPGGWVPGEKISLEEALSAYTSCSAKAGFMEEKVGTLEVGQYADLAVLYQNLFEVNPQDMPLVEVEITLVEGEIVFRKES